jgi:hypothetical protein
MEHRKGCIFPPVVFSPPSQFDGLVYTDGKMLPPPLVHIPNLSMETTVRYQSLLSSRRKKATVKLLANKGIAGVSGGES